MNRPMNRPMRRPMSRSSDSALARFGWALLVGILAGASVTWTCVLLGVTTAFLAGGDGAPWPTHVMLWLLEAPKRWFGVGGGLFMGSTFWGVVSGQVVFVVGLFMRKR